MSEKESNLKSISPQNPFKQQMLQIAIVAPVLQKFNISVQRLLILDTGWFCSQCIHYGQ